MKDLLKIFFFLFIFTISWTNAFSLSQWLTIPNLFIVLSSVVFLFLILFYDYKIKKLDNEDYILILIFLSQLILSSFNITSKFFNYSLAFFYSFFIIYYLNKIISISFFRYDDLLKYNFYAVLFISIFGLSEFFLNYSFNFSIQSYIPRSSIASADYNLIDKVIFRTYVFSEEPTYLAWYLNTLGLISFLYLKKIKNVFKRLLLFLPVIVTYISTFSAAGFILIISSFLIYNIFYFRIKLIFGILLSIFFTLFFVSYYIDLEILQELVNPLTNKITFQQLEDGDRLPEWTKAWYLLLNKPIIGHGLGYYSSLGQYTPMNFFLYISVESGLFITLLIIVFYITKFLKLIKLNSKEKPYFIIALISGIGHLFTQSLFYHPNLWFLIILIDLKIKELRVND